MGKHEPRGELQPFLILYRTKFAISQSEIVHCLDTLRYHDYLVEFG